MYNQILKNITITDTWLEAELRTLVIDGTSAIKQNTDEILEIIKPMQNSIYIAIAIGTIAIIIGIAILWNQRKIKKMLQEMIEEREKEQDSAKETE